MELHTEILETTEIYERELPSPPPALAMPQDAAMAGWIDHTMISAGASRIGSSSGVQIVQQATS
jgi:hypothetical protein